MPEDKTYRRFYRLSTATLVAVYFLILVGGIVRSTGAGMGCPDWPKCFGSWVPPTSESELPDNYKEYYASNRHEKNVRFAKYLTAFGMEDKAEALLADESILIEDNFNAQKTWTEYLNRLTGAIIGLFIMATFFFSLKLIKKDKLLVILSFLTLIITIFQGWIGSIVVSTKLTPWMISIHMLLALVIVMLLIYIRHSSMRGIEINAQGRAKTNIFIIAGLMLMIVQVLLGTQVREAIDVVADVLGNEERGSWIQQLGLEFYIHRSFSIVLLLVHVLLIASVWKLKEQSKVIKKLAYGIGALLILEVLSGVVMAYFGIPPFMQPIHLLLSTLLVGLLFMLYLRVNVRGVHPSNIIVKNL